MIRRKGTIVSFGNASGSVPPVPLTKLVEKNVKLMRPTCVTRDFHVKLSLSHPKHTYRAVNWVVTFEERKQYAEELFRLISDGTLRINIHSEYPFTAAGVRQAQEDLTGGKTTGKLLIKVADE
jgi:NADPH:quinone reductase